MRSHAIDSIEGRARAFVQVQNGCDHRCTFCIIPFARGNSRSVAMGGTNAGLIGSMITSGFTSIETYTGGAFFTMAYPDNLEFVQVPKGNNDFAMEMRADRRDCSIHIDVFGAKGLTVDKVWEQNKGRYKSRGTGETALDGNKTYWVDYSPVANIGSRAYFTVKNDKVIRTTLNWFAPKRDVYFPVLETMVKSMKIK